MRTTLAKLALVALSLLAATIVLAACGGSSESDSTQSTGSETTASAEGGSDQGGGKAKAEEVLAPYIGQPSPFPVTEKLKEVPQNATVAYMDCGAPFCALVWELLSSAADTMGVKIERINAGASASSVTTAYDTVVTKEPDAVISMATPITLWSKQLDQLKEAEIPVIAEGVAAPEAEKYGVPTGPGGSVKATEVTAELLAAYVTAEMSPAANAVLYANPEVAFQTEAAEFFEADLKGFCPECSARVSAIPIGSVGNTAPSKVASDLQANPDTDVAVFMSGDIATGVPTALSAAGIEVESLSNAPGPTNLQYLQEKKETAGLAQDIAVISWTLLDQAARAIIGQKLTGLEAEGIPVYQFLTPEDITFDPSKGWTGYPEFPEMFAELWGVKG